MLHPRGCPNPYPLHSSADYVYSSPRRFASLISSCMIEDAPIYPRYRDLYPTGCDSDRCLLLADCLELEVAQGVENVLHVAGLPDAIEMRSCIECHEPSLLQW
jgi:hypothetical protein